eukprot:tig00000431_g683.t1
MYAAASVAAGHQHRICSIVLHRTRPGRASSKHHIISKTAASASGAAPARAPVAGPSSANAGAAARLLPLLERDLSAIARFPTCTLKAVAAVV